MPSAPSTLVVYRDDGVWLGLNRTRLASVRLMQWRPDFVPIDAEAERVDLLADLPFASGSFDAIYGYHVLEHLDLHEGRRFLSECLRVLRPGGWLRVSTPDFINHLRAYLECLDQARRRPDDPRVLARLAFTRVLLLDQRVRRRSGGRMLDLLRTTEVDREFAMRTHGLTGPWLLDIARGTTSNSNRTRADARSMLLRAIAAIRRRLAVRRPVPWWQRDCRATRELEISNWDEVSLTRELKAAGFEEVTASTDTGASRLPGWNDLDRCPETDADIERSAIAEGRRP
jgi:predicted SAM-dependent methyltransferase